MANPLLNDMFLITDAYRWSEVDQHPTRSGGSVQAGAVTTAEESQAALGFEAQIR